MLIFFVSVDWIYNPCDALLEDPQKQAIDVKGETAQRPRRSHHHTHLYLRLDQLHLYKVTEFKLREKDKHLTERERKNNAKHVVNNDFHYF